MTQIDRRRWLTGALAMTAAPRAGAAQSATLQPRSSGVAEELRGLSLAGRARWVSGAKGTVIVGDRIVRPPGAEALDFRGLHAFSPQFALAMSAGRGEASTLWRTRDGGRSWARIAVNADPDGFWDAIAFADARRGFILGDPTQGRFTLLRTVDGGQSWSRADRDAIPGAYPGEAAFAASNGSLAVGPAGRVAFCSGGLAPYARAYLSRDFGRAFQAIDTPIAAALASRGGFACAFDERGDLWVCGGDYRAPRAEGVNLARLKAGRTSFEAIAAPAGYLSGLDARSGVVVATGLAGTIVSRHGAPFARVDDAPFNAVRLWGRTRAVLVGPKGALATLRV